MTDELSDLQGWYARQCDDDWDHQDGIEINTLDNPGWRVVIDLGGTDLEAVAFAAIEENYDHETAWLRCWVADGQFQAAGGPVQLSRMLRIFLDWAAAHSTIA